MSITRLLMRLVRRSHLLLCSCLLLASCAHQPPPVGDDLPGFFSGWFHGAFALIALIASIFTDVRIYQFPNSGFWYDTGFMVAIMGWVTVAGGSSSH